MASTSPGRLSGYRWKELSLLIIPSAIMLLIMTQLLLANSIKTDALNSNTNFSTKELPPIQGLIPVLGLIAALIVVHLVFNIFFRKADQVLLPLVGLLSGIGVLFATRVGPDLPIPIDSLGSRQLMWVVIGMGLCCITLAVLRNVNWLGRYKYSWALVSFVLALPALINGILSHGGGPTRDSLGVGGTGLQPSELLKITLVIFFAAYLNDNRDILAKGYLRLGKLRLPPLRQLGPLLTMLGLALMIFLIAKDLGLALLIYSTFLSLTYLASGRLTYVLVALGAFVVLGFIGFALLPSYVRDRFAVVSFDVVGWRTWTQQQIDFADGPGYQIMQGLVGLSSGGLFGAGFGLGHPAGKFFIPVVESDLMFSGLGEELGLIGLFAILGLYLLVIHRGYRIAMEATEPFQQLLAAGLTTIFAVQTLVIIAGNLKLMPLTGIPLPFLSQGGSSVIANFIIVGILLRISHNTAVERDGGQ
ncbi:FtsW/RodA/SpoVE family cell cycle protein [Ktedonospora formicarum]|uniref:Cell cycle protein n=1 Tax=Ktedonospora formicarum TaxID=2778364 RepID=A0A8J3I1S3_9CHLR|nr:FtsW/RodA/SpoVE family cell cycle protein [Ktedonospora formicarum]GHO45210.1 cell cycle protein [Ktedonospora formicarum]